MNTYKGLKLILTHERSGKMKSLVNTYKGLKLNFWRNLSKSIPSLVNTYKGLKRLNLKAYNTKDHTVW